METKAYVCFNVNDEIRKNSSSGGVFYELAKKVIEKGGVVFGAKFDEEWNVIHDYAEDLIEIEKFRGSKYVQSKLGSSFEKVKSFLKQNRPVLFSGTPCQISGLKKYLQKDYENLYTVDIICHGVPSPKVWRKYIEKLSLGKKITTINFRDKSEGWVQFGLAVDFSSGHNYKKNGWEDLYMKGFLRDIYLRPSCYDCHFKGISRESDITLADYWGVSEIHPEFDDNKGTSLVLIHSEKGMTWLKDSSSSLKMMETCLERAVSMNSAATTSAKEPEIRSLFYSKPEIDFTYLHQLTKDKNIVIVKKKIVNVLVKIYHGYRKIRERK